MKTTETKQKEIILDINKETCDYLQRLTFEIEANKSVITRLLSDAKDDVDASVLESIPFKTYHKKMEESMYMYETAKNELTNEFKERLGSNNFTWFIDNFSEAKARVIMDA